MVCVRRLVANYQSEQKSRKQLQKMVNANELMLPLEKIDDYKDTVFACTVKGRLVGWMTEEWDEDILFDAMAHMCLIVMQKMAKCPGTIASLMWNMCTQYRDISHGEDIEPLKTIVISGENVRYKTKKATTLGLTTHNYHLLSCLHLAKRAVRGVMHAGEDYIFA